MSDQETWNAITEIDVDATDKLIDLGCIDPTGEYQPQKTAIPISTSEKLEEID